MKKYPYANVDLSFLEMVVSDINADLIDHNFRLDYLTTAPRTGDFDINTFDFSYLDKEWEEKD